ncbi:hypothetical protein CI102_10634 [Trichoderma harzianum]|nr:hypothetical protein CI102_10634 [Trichoderma harzianum]
MNPSTGTSISSRSFAASLSLETTPLVTRSYTIKYPPRDLIPFEKEARFMHLSYREIQGIKSQLYRSVKILYNNGVGYNIYPHHLYLYGSRSWDPTPLLFLGSVTSSDILDVGQLDWKEQRAHVCDQIDRVFAPWKSGPSKKKPPTWPSMREQRWIGQRPSSTRRTPPSTQRKQT